MPSPDSLRIIALIAFPLFFILGIFKPLYMPLSFLTLFLSKLNHYYPLLYDIRAETIVGIFGLIRVMAIKGFFDKVSFKYDSISKYFMLFLACIVISFIFAIDREYSWDFFLFDFIKVIIIYCLILGAINDSAELKIFFWVFVFLFVYLAYEPFYNFITGTGAIKEAYGEVYISDVGIISGHVAAANNMNQMIPIALFLFLSIEQKSMKIFGLIPFIVFISVLVATGSRGGFIGFLFFCVITFLLSDKKINSGIIIGVTAIIVLFFTTTFLYTGSRISSDSIMGRLNGLFHGVEMVLKGNPFGVGPGCYMIARRQYFGYTMMSHNLYGELIGDLGILGTIAWALLIRQVLVNLISAKRKLESLSLQKDFLYYITLGMLISLIVRLVIGMGSHGLYYFYWYLMAAFSIIVVKNVDKQEEKKTISENEESKKRFRRFSRLRRGLIEYDRY